MNKIFSGTRKTKFGFLFAAIVLSASAVFADTVTVADVNHTFLQANDTDGVPTYDDSDKVIIEGIILNNPEYMLDPTPGPIGMGGQWQMFVQPDDVNDTAATAVWMGQNYSITPFGYSDYNDAEFNSQLCDMNFDPNTGYRFNAGDKVKVTGYYKAFSGKLNINEKHQTDDEFDVVVELITPAAGLPKPELITLDMVKTGFGEDDFAFYGADRSKGCERYQGRLVRVNDVNIVNPENWASGESVNIKDSQGYSFKVKLGLGKGFELFDAPSGQIDVIGIFNQEDMLCSVCDGGYEIWVTNYDGNGLVLTDRGHQRVNLPGDVNYDAKVDFADLAITAQDWLDSVSSLCDCQ